MKKLFTTAVLLSFFILGYSQIDTISQNIYQLNGRIGIGKVNYGSYFNPCLMLYHGWLQVSDSGYNDAGLVVSHLSKSGYGFARTLQMVHEGVNGDPYTEFRIRSTSDSSTITSWSIGADNSDSDKLVISNVTNVTTGASPSVGEKLVTIKTTGELGIGTTDPKAKLEIANGDVYISDIEKGIIMKSPNGQCWRGTLDNSGVLNFTSINCPESEITTFQELKSTKEIFLYPNPTDGKISILIKDINQKDLSFTFYDLTGKILNSGKITSNSKTLDISQYNVGTYILSINDRNGAVLSSGMIIKK